MSRFRGSFALVCAAALVLIGAVGLQPATASARPGFIETQTSDPVTAAPPVSTPPTPHCTVTLADQFPSNAADGTPQNYSGTLTPPAGCPGPWAKVVLTHTISVSGRQYDRVDSLKVGDSDIYWGTTEEPSGPTPTTYTFSKDVTEYSALLRTSQPFVGGIGNYTSSVYTGNYLQTVTMTYYQATRHHRAPDEPDMVVGLGADSLNPSTLSSEHTLSDLPRNITRAYLEVTLEGGGCDEQWFSDVPDDVAAKYASAGMCGHGPYREADVSLDGQPVAAVHTFPHIYSGGIVPTLWRPIPAIGTFDLLPETVDVTPFAATLVDGGTHQLGYRVQDLGDSWSVVTNLLLYTDHHAAQTHGAITADDVSPGATEQVDESDVSAGTRIVDTTSRRDVTSGWLQTSAGRTATTVVRTMHYRNDDTVTDGGLTQSIRQSDAGAQTVTYTRDGRVVAAHRHSYSYPLRIDYSAADFVDDQNFSLSGTVNMTQMLHDEALVGRRWRPVDGSVENVNSYGILARTNGATSESDGHSTSFFVGTNDRGRLYRHYLASNHGMVTRDVT
jgi:hypothetical protein